MTHEELIVRLIRSYAEAISFIEAEDAAEYDTDEAHRIIEELLKVLSK